MTTATVLEHRGLPYRRAGATGLLLPAFSLGLWQGFGSDRDQRTQASLITGAFDRGVTHFDNANRYGPPFGWAERVLGEVLRTELAAHRDEITITTKAGRPVGDHPYAVGGSRKHLLDAVDTGLARLGTDHVDVFYHHAYDPGTPLEETATALADIARQGKARYLGLSNYPAAPLAEIVALLRELRAPLALVQPGYSLLDRAAEEPGGVLDIAAEAGLGVVVYSPLAQGRLTTKYLDGAVPATSRAAWSTFLDGTFIDDAYLATVGRLDEAARARGASLPQAALQWVLRRPEVTSVLLGASRLEQLDENLGALRVAELTEADADELEAIASGTAAERVLAR
ncbi:aldo/keto reductase [Agromyces sp. MMS24-K17]|uniref:aldo/keto reductase n=1 Tax=Agromyces sp. MMS24-K17 TaxID=3372850 RepID=UPI003754AF12